MPEMNPEIGLPKDASRGGDSLVKAVNGEKKSKVKSKGDVGLNSMAFFLLNLLYNSFQSQRGDNWGRDSWKSLDLVIIKPVGS